MAYTIWEFKTGRFTVKVTAEEEHDFDLSWDDNGEITEKINSGALCIFCAKAAVYLDGNEISADYLGQCIYDNPWDFRDHVGIGETAYLEAARVEVCEAFDWYLIKLNRLNEQRNAGCVSTSYYRRSTCHHLEKLAEARREFAHKKRCAGKIGSYFTDMVRSAIREAREQITEYSPPYIRETAA